MSIYKKFDQTLYDQCDDERRPHAASKIFTRAQQWRRWAGVGTLVASCLLLVSCAGVRDIPWPQDLPERAYFRQAYSTDLENQRYQTLSEYLQWVENFYHGSLLYPTGWQDVEATILATLSPVECSQQQTKLRSLGRDIAAEWAKHNDVRLIDNRMLSLWGSVLQLAPDARHLTRAIAVITADIEAIFARQLRPDKINPLRYEAMLDIQLFDDF